MLRRQYSGFRRLALLLALALLFYIYGPFLFHPTTTSTDLPANQQSAAEENKDGLNSYHPQQPVAKNYVNQVKTWWGPWAEAINKAAPSVQAISQKELYMMPDDNETLKHTPRVLGEKNLVLPVDVLQDLHMKHRQFQEHIEQYSSYKHDVDSLFHGRGVVVVGGGSFYGMTILGIKMLRDTGSNLPVEVFLANWDEYVPELCEDYLPKLDAKCLVITDLLGDSIPHISHFQYKSVALVLCSFKDVLLVDADSLPLVDPAQLFDSDAYRLTGMITWPDFWFSSEAPEFWSDVVGVPFPTDLPSLSPESGQMLFDKSRHLKTLMLALYYNVYGPEVYYKLFSSGGRGEGDKFTFEAAADVLGDTTTYYRVHQSIQAAGRFVDPPQNQDFKAAAMLQHFPEAVPDTTSGFALHGGVVTEEQKTKFAFLHSNVIKPDAARLVDGEDLVDADGTHVRLYGGREQQEETFGEDVERRIWKHLEDSACQLEHIIWKDARPELCTRLREHVKAVFPN